LDKEPNKTCAVIIQQMQHWLADPSFISVRDNDALAKLPEAERAAWQKIWAGVADTLARAQGKATAKKE
jgi:hypothetical protein